MCVQRERAGWGAKLPLYLALHPVTGGVGGQLAFPGLTLGALSFDTPRYARLLEVVCTSEAAGGAAAAAGVAVPGGTMRAPSGPGDAPQPPPSPAVGGRFGYVATPNPISGETVGVVAVVTAVQPRPAAAGGGFVVTAKCLSRFR